MKNRLRWYFFPALLFIIFSVVDLSSAEYGRYILGMYKSSDGYNNRSNPIQWYFEPEIRRLGLKIRYHDLDSGMPDPGTLNGVRAILTWYNSAVVEDKNKALRYAGFLNSALDSGVKLIIVNSFGAYGYRDGGEIKWDLIPSLRPLFFKLGFNFAGYWTSDPGKLRIAMKDPVMVEKDETQDVTKSRHYQQIVPLREDVTTYLQIKRIDGVKGIGDGNSSVILTSRYGGFALEQYVVRGKKLLLNPALFLRRSLFYDDGYQNVGVILGDSKKGRLIIENISYACDYAKIDSTVIDANQLQSMVAEDLSPFEVILVVTDTVKGIPAPLMRAYVQGGGKLVFLKFTDLSREYMQLLGLRSYGSDAVYFEDGFSVKSDFFMGGIPLSGKKIDLNVRRAQLTDGRVLAAVRGRAHSGFYPVLWERSLGRGRILYWNTDLLTQGKRFRGTIVQSMHRVESGFVSGLANIGMMMIDDFPAPWWNTYYKQYRQQYYSNLLSKETDRQTIKRLQDIIRKLKAYPEQSDTDFIRNVWIRDIQSFQKQFGLRYSSYLIFNYSRETGVKKEDAFSVRDFYLAENGLTVRMGRWALENGWDLGLHGYNHMSMTLTRPREYASEPWPDRESMVRALTVSRREWEKLYGNSVFPFSYVAPHNIIDDTGLSALGEVFPSIRVVATVYIGKQGEREQEFAWTRDRRFYQIPRLTSGYYMDSSNRYAFYDMIHNFGVISHFIHPDDAFDEHRSAGFSGWNWMKKQFVRELTVLKKNFPWIRWMTVRDAFGEFLFYGSADIRVRKAGKLIQVESSDGSDRYLYFRLRLEKNQRIGRLRNCTLVHENKRTGDMVFKTSDYRATITLR